MVKEMPLELQTGSYDGKTGEKGLEIDITPEIRFKDDVERRIPLEDLGILQRELPEIDELESPITAEKMAERLIEIGEELPEYNVGRTVPASPTELPIRPARLPLQETRERPQHIEITPSDHIPQQIETPGEARPAPPAMRQEQLQQFLEALQAAQGGQVPPGRPGMPRQNGIEMYADDFSLPDPDEENAPDLAGARPGPAPDDRIQIDIGRALDTYKAESTIDGADRRDTLAQQLSHAMKHVVNRFLIEKHGEDAELSGVPKSYRLDGRQDAEEITRRVLKAIIKEQYGFSRELVEAAQEDHNVLYQVFDSLIERRGYSELFINYVGNAGKNLAAGRPFEGTAKTLGQRVAGIKLKKAKSALANDAGSRPQIEELVNRALREHGKEVKPGVEQEELVEMLGVVFAEDGRLYETQVHDFGYAVRDLRRR